MGRNRFQFHKGAIRTGYSFYRTGGYHHFNSIKVRLERYSAKNVCDT